MKQAFGIAMILVGGLFFHVASTGASPNNLYDVWTDFINVLNATSSTLPKTPATSIPAIDFTNGATGSGTIAT